MKRDGDRSDFRILAGALLDAEVRLGELFTVIPKDERVKTDLGRNGSTQTKYQVIAALSFDDPKKPAMG